MKLSKLETLILADTSDDYENISWLTQDRSKQVGFPVDEEMVTESLRRLASEGLVNVFHYDFKNPKQEFIPTTFDEDKPRNELWFLISPKGREAVDDNWDESWLREA